jgi:hypothetical protein
LPPVGTRGGKAAPIPTTAGATRSITAGRSAYAAKATAYKQAAAVIPDRSENTLRLIIESTLGSGAEQKRALKSLQEGHGRPPMVPKIPPRRTG